MCTPLFFITFSALWVWRGSDHDEEKFHAFSRGYLRYLPALILGGIALLYTGKTGNAYIPGIFGILLLIYSLILLKIDAKEPR